MKKILIATTALVAFASAANAAEPIKLSVGGYAEQWVGYAENDDDVGAAKFDVQGDTEIHVKGSTKLDNGLTIAVNVEVEAQGPGATSDGGSIDESYITVSGAFGALIVGQTDNVGEMIHNASPDVGIGNQDGDFMNWVARPADAATFGAEYAHLAPTTTYADVDGDADKIIYVTPAFAGIQAGISYTPDIAAGNAGDQSIASNGNGADLLTGTGEDLWVGGFAYNGAFGGVTVKADVGAGWAGMNDARVYQGGLNVGFAGFTVGGSYLRQNLDDVLGATDVQTDSWDLGVSYETGPYAVSLTYFDSNADLEDLDLEEATQSWMLSGSYTMGPGVAAKASVFHVDYESDAGAARENDGWGIVTGLRLDF